MGTASISLGVLTYTSASYLFPGSDSNSAGVLAAFFSIFVGLMYTLFTWAIPRSGDDYVWVSRVCCRGRTSLEDKRSLREPASENESCRNSTYLNLSRHLLDLLRALGILLPHELTLRRQYSGRIRSHRLLLSRADHNLRCIILLLQKQGNRPVACVPRDSA